MANNITQVLAFNVKVLDGPRKCVWNKDEKPDYICPNTVIVVVMQPNDENGITKMLMGYFCKPHYSDMFPELARQDGVFN